MSTGAWARSRAAAFGAALWVLLACGARAMVDPSGEPADGGGVGGAAGAGQAGARASATVPGDGAAGAVVNTPGAGCAPSFRRFDAPDRPCPYIYRGICYGDDVCACASACSRGARCVIGGFLEPDEPQRVRCMSP